MMAHGASKYAPFYVAPFADETIWRVAMRDPLNILLNDRSLIEVGCHVMRRRTDQLNASLMGLVIWLGPFEPWQKRMVC